MTKVIRVLEIE